MKICPRVWVAPPRPALNFGQWGGAAALTAHSWIRHCSRSDALPLHLYLATMQIRRQLPDQCWTKLETHRGFRIPIIITAYHMPSVWSVLAEASYTTPNYSRTFEKYRSSEKTKNSILRRVGPMSVTMSGLRRPRWRRKLRPICVNPSWRLTSDYIAC